MNLGFGFDYGCTRVCLEEKERRRNVKREEREKEMETCDDMEEVVI